jgi:hypothetical protein
MNILKNVLAQDLFLYVPDYNAFILSDVHLGYEESLNRQGILVPRNSYNDLTLRIEKALAHIMKTYSVDKIIINGDLIHEFGKISRREKDLTRSFIKFLSGYGKLTLILGNHDTMLKFFINSIDGVEIKENLFLGDILILHGDKTPSKNLLKDKRIRTIIIGHEHPSVALSSGSRCEKYKCFLRGQYERRDLIVMPSCNLFIEGTDVLREKLLSPLLKHTALSRFEVFVIEDKIYDFGKLGSLIKKFKPI